MFRSAHRLALLSSHLKAPSSFVKLRRIAILPKTFTTPNMSHLFEADTPDEVKNAKVCFGWGYLSGSGVRGLMVLQGLHLVTMSTPNGQKVQIMLEELHDIYGTEWTYSLMYGFFSTSSPSLQSRGDALC